MSGVKRYDVAALAERFRPSDTFDDTDRMRPFTGAEARELHAALVDFTALHAAAVLAARALETGVAVGEHSAAKDGEDWRAKAREGLEEMRAALAALRAADVTTEPERGREQG